MPKREDHGPVETEEPISDEEALLIIVDKLLNHLCQKGFIRRKEDADDKEIEEREQSFRTHGKTKLETPDT